MIVTSVMESKFDSVMADVDLSPFLSSSFDESGTMTIPISTSYTFTNQLHDEENCRADIPEVACDKLCSTHMIFGSIEPSQAGSSCLSYINSAQHFPQNLLDLSSESGCQDRTPEATYGKLCLKRYNILSAAEKAICSTTDTNGSSAAPHRGQLRAKFTPPEDQLIIRLRNSGKTWKEIANQIPGRSPGALQVRYSTKLKSKSVTWTKDIVCILC